ncbi:VacJ family lipoprotein [Neisseriaceae bacterium JH1-16]|nr:VacJ family lipoprotein [Neisseriaceae bacterium JH1-16]
MILVLVRDHSTSCRAGIRALRSGFSLLLLSVFLNGCATGPNANPNDPLEPLNRAIFNVNDKVDEYVAIPVAKGYRAVTPQPLQTAFTNFFGNLADVGNTVNNLLQGKGVAAMESLMRVAVNTVFGLGGLLDIATPAGLHKHSQDFGLTLGRWGLPSGPYVVLPIFGPSSFRDGMGLYVNFQLDPLTYTRPEVRNSLYGLEFVSARTNMLGATDLLSQAALDKYSFVRDAYQQQRRYLIQEGRGTTKLPVYEDYEDPGEGQAKQESTQDGATVDKPPAHDGADGIEATQQEKTQERIGQERLPAREDASGAAAEPSLTGAAPERGVPSKPPVPGEVKDPAMAPVK